jgi:peptidoglycan/LPS O-acetylase OafA/YrhL
MSSTTASGRPTSVTVSFIIWLVVVLANILSGIINLVSGGGSSSTADSVGTAPLVGGAIFAFILAVVEVIIVFKMRDGWNWARIVLLVLAILQLIGVGVGAASGGNAFGWIGAVAVLVATILMFVGGANGYFRRR